MTEHISALRIDEKLLIRSEQFKHRRERVITDMLKSNEFKVPSHNGPYELDLIIEENKLKLAIDCTGSKTTEHVAISLTRLRRIIKDYAIVCDTYFAAVNSADPQKVEAIDMGRRSLHNEGADSIQDMCDGLIEMDFETARKFFTLICELQST